MADVLVLGGGAPKHDLPTLRRLLGAPLARGGAARAWIFGSRARGEADRYSDLDLLVTVDRSDVPFVERWRAFAEILDIEPATDLLVFTEAELASAIEDENPLVLRVLEEGIAVDVRR